MFFADSNIEVLEVLENNRLSHRGSRICSSVVGYSKRNGTERKGVDTWRTSLTVGSDEGLRPLSQTSMRWSVDVTSLLTVVSAFSFRGS